MKRAATVITSRCRMDGTAVWQRRCRGQMEPTTVVPEHQQAVVQTQNGRRVGLAVDCGKGTREGVAGDGGGLGVSTRSFRMRTQGHLPQVEGRRESRVDGSWVRFHRRGPKCDESRGAFEAFGLSFAAIEIAIQFRETAASQAPRGDAGCQVARGVHSRLTQFDPAAGDLDLARGQRKLVDLQHGVPDVHRSRRQVGRPV